MNLNQASSSFVKLSAEAPASFNVSHRSLLQVVRLAKSKTDRHSGRNRGQGQDNCIKLPETSISSRLESIFFASLPVAHLEKLATDFPANQKVAD